MYLLSFLFFLASNLSLDVSLDFICPPFQSFGGLFLNFIQLLIYLTQLGDDAFLEFNSVQHRVYLVWLRDGR